MTGFLVEALIASTALMLLVLVLRAPVRRAFGPDVAYALWALPVLRLVMPPLPASWREIAAAPISAASETITIYVTQPLGPVVESQASVPVAAMIAGLWVVGSIAFLTWHALAHLRFCRRMLDQQIRGSEIDGGIHLIETEAANGPLAFGVMRKYVAFPRDFIERYDQDERDLALAHELGHHARGDLIANWIALGVLALHWFNPIAWRAFRAFRADQEIANDARVLAGLSATARHTYACAIVKSAHGGAVSAACHLHTINDLKGRLKMLTTNKTSRKRLMSGIAAVTVLTLAGLGLTASGTQAAETVRTKVERATGIELTSFQVAPPAVPEAPELAEMPEMTEVPAMPELPETPDMAAMPVPPAPPTVLTIGPNSRQVTTTTTTTTGNDGKRIKHVKVIVRDKDGKYRTESYDGEAAIANMPEVRSENCTTGSPKEMVVNRRVGDKRQIIICNNRIEKAAADGAAAGAAVAANSAEIQRSALKGAIAGLRGARAGIEANRDMAAAQRTEALKGIDDAIAEVTKEMADIN